MGFHCPKCKQDFGADKSSFNQHLKEEGLEFDECGLAMTNMADLIKGSNVFGLLDYKFKRVK